MRVIGHLSRIARLAPIIACLAEEYPHLPGMAAAHSRVSVSRWHKRGQVSKATIADATCLSMTKKESETEAKYGRRIVLCARLQMRRYVLADIQPLSETAGFPSNETKCIPEGEALWDRFGKTPGRSAGPTAPGVSVTFSEHITSHLKTRGGLFWASFPGESTYRLISRQAQAFSSASQPYTVTAL